MILFLQSYEKELKHGCYIHFRAAIICSFADISVPLQPRVGPIVQWIERRFPKELMQFDGYNIEIVKIGRQQE